VEVVDSLSNKQQNVSNDEQEEYQNSQEEHSDQERKEDSRKKQPSNEEQNSEEDNSSSDSKQDEDTIDESVEKDSESRDEAMDEVDPRDEVIDDVDPRDEAMDEVDQNQTQESEADSFTLSSLENFQVSSCYEKIPSQNSSFGNKPKYSDISSDDNEVKPEVKSSYSPKNNETEEKNELMKINEELAGIFPQILEGEKSNEVGGPGGRGRGCFYCFPELDQL